MYTSPVSGLFILSPSSATFCTITTLLGSLQLLVVKFFHLFLSSPVLSGLLALPSSAPHQYHLHAPGKAQIHPTLTPYKEPGQGLISDGYATLG